MHWFLALWFVGASAGVGVAQDWRMLLKSAGEAEAAFRFAEAESNYGQALNLLESLRHPDNDTLINTHLALSAVQLWLSHLPQADSTLNNAWLAIATTAGHNSIHAAACLNRMGQLQSKLGNLARAERLLRRAMSIAESLGGSEHPEVGRALYHLSFVCRQQNRYEEGKALARRAIEIFKTRRECPAEDLTLAYLALGWNERAHGGYVLARDNFLRAHAVATAAYDGRHPVCAVVYNHFAGLDVNLVDGARGLLNANRALAIVEQTLGPDNLEAGFSHWYLQRAYIYVGMLEESLAEADIAERILTSHLGELHPSLGLVCGFRSWAYRLMNRFDDALAEARRAGGLGLGNFHANSLHLDDQATLLAAWGTFDVYSTFASYHFDNPNPTPEQSRQLAELVVTCKGITDVATNARIAMQRTTDDPVIRQLSARLGKLRSRRSLIYFSDPLIANSSTRRELEKLSSEEKRLLLEIAERGQDTEYFTLAQSATLEQVCNRIPENACLVEFYYFRYVYPTVPEQPYREEGRLGVVVLDRNGVRGNRTKSRWNHELADSLQMWRLLMEERASQPSWNASARRRLDQLSRNLYDRTWASFSDLIGDDELTIVCPDLLLATVPFGALLGPEGKYLVETHAIQYLSAARELLRVDSHADGTRGLFALADPDFNATPDVRLAATEESGRKFGFDPVQEFAVRNVRPGCERLDSLKLGALPNTRHEIDRVIDACRSSFPLEPEYSCVGASASEEVVKRLAPESRLVHLATHGYYIDAECRKRTDLRELANWINDPNQLLYSGLLLAGANLGGRGADSLKAEDGILTAGEITALDLSGVDLAVLSACETGLGEDFVGQGTFGVARAFQIAGARQVVSTLWPVSDASSAEFMSAIYEDVETPVCEKLRRTAIRMINEDRKHGRTPDPFFWAPYVSYGDWRAR